MSIESVGCIESPTNRYRWVPRAGSCFNANKSITKDGNQTSDSKQFLQCHVTGEFRHIRVIA